jgi:ADP-ribosylglycohydrolase
MGRHFSFCNNKRALESLLVPEDYWESICTAVFPGGDVDTTAAMTGAVSGAHVGIEGIPDDWARRVTDLGEWEYNDLVILATRCYELRSKTDHY